MWPILLLVSIGFVLTLLTLILLRMEPAQTQALRRGTGIALVVIAALCFATGAAGHAYSESRMAAFVEEKITDPELHKTASREARVPLEAAVAPGVAFLVVGFLAARRKPTTLQLSAAEDHGLR